MKKIIQNIVENADGRMHTPHPPGCIITKKASNFKRNVSNQKYGRQLRHDCCKEVKGMLSDETGETIFKC